MAGAPAARVGSEVGVVGLMARGVGSVVGSGAVMGRGEVDLEVGIVVGSGVVRMGNVGLVVLAERVLRVVVRVDTIGDVVGGVARGVDGARTVKGVDEVGVVAVEVGFLSANRLIQIN